MQPPQPESSKRPSKISAWIHTRKLTIKAYYAKRCASLENAWRGLESREKLTISLAVFLCLGFIGLSANEAFIQKLEQPYAKFEKLKTSGVLSADEPLKFSTDSAIKLLASHPDAQIIEFVYAGEARGRVSNLMLLKSPGATYPLMVGPTEREQVHAYLQRKDMAERLKIVDFETLDPVESERAQGLALRLGPPSKQGSEALWRGLVLVFNALLTIGVLIMVLSMLNQSRKRVKFIRPSSIKGSLSDLIGMEDIKSEVLRTKDLLNNREAYKAYGVDRPTNILFSGPPGTGKTKLAGFLAKELGLPILFHSAANLETGFVNGGSQTLDRVLALAKKEKRCLVFLDEAQDLFMKRGGSGRKFDDDTQNTLLSILDGVRTTKDSEIIWVVASNFNANSMQMDDAMLRRFQLKIDFRLPNAKEREGIFSHYLSKAEGKVSPDLDMGTVVHITEQSSPADIESIVYEAGVAAIQVQSLITTDILLQAAERTLVGNTDVETTAGREREREIIALHEVGHFLVDVMRHRPDGLARAMDAKPDIGSLKISLKAHARSNALGFVLKRPRINLLQTKQDLMWEVRTLFGGMANEEIFFGPDGVTNGAYSDIQEVTKLLSSAVTGMGLFKDAKLNFSALAIPGQDVVVSAEDREVMTRVSKQLFDESKAMLEAHKELSRYLANALISAIELKTEDMLALIEKYHREFRVDVAPEAEGIIHSSATLPHHAI